MRILHSFTHLELWDGYYDTTGKRSGTRPTAQNAFEARGWISKLRASTKKDVGGFLNSGLVLRISSWKLDPGMEPSDLQLNVQHAHKKKERTV
ncbi:jg24548 [Pararge aegeria aegeria]|uniref:Jg24548 protein n=1 Tax=Pararge aegeria aegeria TaxID=348720 RepID=A0A8S4SQJ7_9NEOP|nr:jg24548 [Pararge aegeria aegeria]